jgi:acetyl esterase
MASLAHKLLTRARKRAGGLFLDAFFRGASNGARALAGVRPEDWGIRVHRDLPYLGSGRAAHRLDVWSAYEPHRGMPVVFYVHGGGFRILSKDTHWNFALAFARLGYVVVTIDYTLSGERPFPAAVDDVVAAWTWTLDNVARFGGDPSAIVVAGESAGGNLVTALTVMATMERPEPVARDVFNRGVVPIATMPACPILQVSNPERFEALEPNMPTFFRDRLWEVCGSYLGDPTAVARPSAALADPICILESDAPAVRPLPPFFSLCGTADFCVHDSRRLAANLTSRGVRCEHPEYEGELHAFHAVPLLRNSRIAWREQRAFLSTALGDREPKPLRLLRKKTDMRRR